MTILGSVKFCDNGTYTIVDDHWRKPTGETIAKWLFSLTADAFCVALQSMLDDGMMNMDKADKTMNAYVDKYDTTYNAYEGDN